MIHVELMDRICTNIPLFYLPSPHLHSVLYCIVFYGVVLLLDLFDFSVSSYSWVE